MNKAPFPEDDMLVALLDDKAVWSQAYMHFRAPALAFMTNWYGVYEEEATSVLKLAFATLRQEVAEGGISLPLQMPLYSHLLLFADVYWEERLGSRYPVDRFLDQVLPDEGKYYGSETLLLLLKEGHSEASRLVYEKFRKPAIGTWKRMVPNGVFEADEVYGEAIAQLEHNIREGRISPKLTARLFTYFFIIFRNLHTKILPKERVFDEAPVLEKEIFPPRDTEDYLRRLRETIPSLPFLFSKEDMTPLEFALSLISGTCQEILLLRYCSEGQKELKHQEVASILGISEEAARKRCFDCLELLRKKLDIRKGSDGKKEAVAKNKNSPPGKTSRQNENLNRPQDDTQQLNDESD